MKGYERLRPVFEAFRGQNLKPTVILLVSSSVLITWKCFGSPQFYLDHLAARFSLWNDPEATAAVYTFASCFLLMAVLPALIVKLVFRERLTDYGVQFGVPKRTLRTLVIWIPVFVFAGYLASRDAQVLTEYPINPHAGSSYAMFGFHACAYVLFYLGWEFYFRGFMQFGLRDSLGAGNALLVQVLASVLLHLGKPTGEVYGSILGGILWGLLAYRTRSLLSGFLQHLALGLALDWFICFG